MPFEMWIGNESVPKILIDDIKIKLFFKQQSAF